MASEWYLEVESEIFTTIEYMLAERENAPFPNLRCTATNENITPSYFPTLYLWHSYKGDGYDLDGRVLGGISSTINIKVWTNTTEMECDKILAEAEKVMREVFRYRCNQMPMATVSSKIVSGQIICNRMVGAGENLQ